MRDMFQYVKAYLDLGWQPIPTHYAVDGVCSCVRSGMCYSPGKHPVPNKWQSQAFTEEALKSYWDECKDYNIGLVTGTRTNLVALDVDAKSGGYESLHTLEEKHGILPHTTTASTGGGGKHYLFQYPKGILIPTKGNILSGLDVRGEGGQIIAPPSWHDSGKRRYSWVAGCTPKDISPVPMPDWLIALLEQQEAVWEGAANAHEETSGEYYTQNRNSNLFALGRRLRVIKDFTEDELRQMLHLFNKSKCRPPLADEEVERIIVNVLRKGGSQVVIPKGQSGQEPGTIRVFKPSDIWAQRDKKIDYLVPNLLGRKEVCILAAPTEAGKSIIAQSLALSVAAGKPAWGRGEACPQGRVMYCTEEIADNTFLDRFQRLAKGLGIEQQDVESTLLLVPQQNLSLALTKPENIDALILKAQEFKPDLVILDTLVSYLGAPDKDADIIRAWFSAVPIAIRNQTGAAVIVQHHVRKQTRKQDGETLRYSDMSDQELQDEIRGSGDLAGVVERLFFIWKKSEEATDFGPTVHINVRNTKARSGDKHDPFLLILADPDEDTTTVKCVIAAKSKKFKEAEEQVRKLLPEGECVTKEELAKRMMATGSTKATVYRRINKLKDDGVLVVTTAKDGTHEFHVNLNRNLP